MRTEDEELRDDARARRLLAGLPPAAPGAVARVRARVQAEARPRPSAGRLVAVATITSLAAGLGLFLTGRALEPAPKPPVAVAAALETTGGWVVHGAVPNVSLSYQGTGAIEGTSDAPRIRWETGTLNVDVTSGRGIQLAVETREAVVRVVGTGFTVDRDALGTRVDVRHGRVEVDCGEELTRVLDAGDTVTCLPRSAAGLLGRARALQAEGAAPAAVLEAIERGLALADGPAAVRDELTASRIRVLFDLGRNAEVLDAARSYLGSGAATRKGDVETLAANAAIALGGCATAAPWLAGTSSTAAAICGR